MIKRFLNVTENLVENGIREIIIESPREYSSPFITYFYPNGIKRFYKFLKRKTYYLRLQNPGDEFKYFETAQELLDHLKKQIVKDGVTDMNNTHIHKLYIGAGRLMLPWSIQIIFNNPNMHCHYRYFKSEGDAKSYLTSLATTVRIGDYLDIESDIAQNLNNYLYEKNHE